MIARALRFAALAVVLVLAGSAAAFGWRIVAPVHAIAPPDGPCTEIGLVSNGYHTDLVIPVAMLEADHPLRTLYPPARTLTIGWGDRDAYRFSPERPWLNVMALIPPSPSVLHVAADVRRDVIPLPLSAEGVRGLSGYLRRAVRVGADGRAIYVSEGYHPGRSAFIEGRDEFHVFRLCNHWTAGALKAGGLRVSTLGAWSAASVTRQVGAGARCPAR